MRSVALAAILLVPACTEIVTEPAEPTPSASAADGDPQGRGGQPKQGTVDPEDRPHRREFSVVLAGDVLLHDGLWDSARADAAAAGGKGLDFKPLLRNMRPVFRSADLAICHLETPLAEPGGPYQNYPLFSSPPQIAPALKWAGFDACTTASNHAVDQGFEGLTRTLRTLDRHGIEHAGTARTRKEARRPAIMDVDGIKVGIISQTYGVNGMPVEKPWSVQQLDVGDILRRARHTRAAGADVVLVGLHWGLEYHHEPTTDQRRIAGRLLRSKHIDLVYGHHAHVVQPFGKRHGKWVAYGLGNMVAQQETEVTGVYEGVTARFTFRERPGGEFTVSEAEYIPSYITEYQPWAPRMRLLRITRALRTGSKFATDAELAAALRRVNEAVDLLGARSRGLRLAR